MFSGAEYSLSQLLKSLDRKKYQPVICFDYPMPHQKRYKEADVDLCWRSDGLKCWMGSDRWDNPVRGTDLLKRMILGYQLMKMGRHYEAKIAHINLLWPNSYLDLLFAKFAGMARIGHLRSLGPWFRLPVRVIRLCDAIICVSDTVKKNLNSWASHPSVFRIYNPIDVSRYECQLNKDEAKKALGLPVQARIVSSVALLSPHKGHDIAIRAFASFAAEFPDVMLLIAGGPPSDASKAELLRLRKIANELNVDKRVIFTERQVPNVELVYKASEFVYALTVYGEAFGRVAVETGAAGRVIIATSLGATPEVVIHEKTGLLVPANEVEPVVEWSKRILKDSNNFQSLGIAAHEYVSSQFSPEIHAEKVQTVYDMILRHRFSPQHKL